MLGRTSCSKLNFEQTSKLKLDMEIQKLLGTSEDYRYVLRLFKHYVIFNELIKFQILKPRCKLPTSCNISFAEL